MPAQNSRRVALGKRRGWGQKPGRGGGKGKWAGCVGGGRQGAGEAGRGRQDLQKGTALPLPGLWRPECEDTLGPAQSLVTAAVGEKMCPVPSAGWRHSLPPPWEHTHHSPSWLFQAHSVILRPIPRPVYAGPSRGLGGGLCSPAAGFPLLPPENRACRG